MSPDEHPARPTGNPSTVQARVVVDELIRHGVRDAVVCPGSRSAPLALALAAADRAGAFRLHVRVDERTAGFLALGLAAGSGMPVPVLVTSGTAVANLHPAMVEAALSGVPVLALTANRPPELRGTGANQTIDQVGLFGPHARAVVELPVAVSADEHTLWRAALGRAVLTARDPAGTGPVQVDLALREPLLPEPGDEHWVPGDGTIPPGRPGGRPWVSRPVTGGDRRSAEGAIALDLTRPTLVVAGAGARPVAELLGLPTVAEPEAPVPLRPVHPLALRELYPSQVVLVGRPTLHRSVTELMRAPDVDLLILDDGPRWPDPTATASRVATSVLTGWGADEQWLRTAEEADARARRAVAEHLADSPVSGLHVAHVVAAGVRSGDHLVVGASTAIRDLSYAPPLDADVTVHSNRGASGIDGTVSTAIGVALASPGRTVAYMGDLTFLHDVGALAIGPGEPRPADLTIIVSDDSGGAIFQLLEQGDPRLSRDFERVFGTDPGADIPTLCAGYGVDCRTVTPGELASSLAESDPAGLRVLRVVTRRDDLRSLHERIRRSIRAGGTPP